MKRSSVLSKRVIRVAQLSPFVALVTLYFIAEPDPLMGTPLPEPIDHLVAQVASGNTDGTPIVNLLLDSSGSMGGGKVAVPCGGKEDKMGALKILLNGCTQGKTFHPGFLDNWHERAIISIREFASSKHKQRAGFGSTLSQLKAAVSGITAGGGTHMTYTQGWGNNDGTSRSGGGAGDFIAEYDKTSTDPDMFSCNPMFQILFTDGHPNGGSDSFNYGAAASTSWTYGALKGPKRHGVPRGCDGGVTESVGSNSPEYAARYNRLNDILCHVPGKQFIRTFAIGIGGYDSAQLARIVAPENGDGTAFDTENFEELSLAFNTALEEMVVISEKPDFFAPSAVQTTGLFSSNTLFTGSFKPELGPWGGNVKKHCVEPDRYKGGTGDPVGSVVGKYKPSRECMFYSSDGDNLRTNRDVVDQWSGTSTTAVMFGGAARTLSARLTKTDVTGLAEINPEPDPNKLWDRNIVTWRSDQEGYVKVHKDTWYPEDTDANADELNHHRLINRLHGYTYEADAADGTPLAVSPYPMGDPVHGSTILLRYARDCETEGTCWVVVPNNHGMLEFIDASDSAKGKESTALIPAEFWRLNSIARHRLLDIQDQPNEGVTKKWFLDGDIRLFHDDCNGNGIIDDPGTASCPGKVTIGSDVRERAYVIFGLGRGGRGYYSLPVSKFDGTLSDTVNPVYPLVATPGAAYNEMRDTWRAPWLGQTSVAGVKKNVAVFASGHIHDHDAPNVELPALAPNDNLSFVDAGEDDFKLHGCGTWAAHAGLKPNEDCKYWNNNKKKGYADPGPNGLDISNGGTWWDLAAREPDITQFRLSFVGFELDPNVDGDGNNTDVLEIIDENGTVVHAFSAANPPVAAQGGHRLSSWINGTKFQWRFRTDGNNTKHRGWHIGQIHYREGNGDGGTQPLDGNHYPTVFVVDLDKWNGDAPQAFVRGSNEGGLLTRFSRTCLGDNKTGECYDADDFDDLKYMVCSITTEVSVLTVNGLMSAMYWGDDCGQIFTAKRTPGGVWSANRLFYANDVAMSTTQGDGIGLAKDFRQILRRIDIVSTTCPGRPATGLYFGTGNEQRPVTFNELEDGTSGGTLNNGRNIVGVLWDDGTIPAGGYTVASLTDVTSTDKLSTIDLVASKGWYWNLGEDERMLRDPLVFEGVAYYKTWKPLETVAAPVAEGTCGGAALVNGEDAVYAVNNCSARAAVDQNTTDGHEYATTDRRAFNNVAHVGSNFLVVTRKGSAPIVSHADLSADRKATIGRTRFGRIPRIFNWRRAGGH